MIIEEEKKEKIFNVIFLYFYCYLFIIIKENKNKTRYYHSTHITDVKLIFFLFFILEKK